MILTCPQCETRYQADAAKFPAAGRSVRCAKCGNVWHQIGPAPEPDPDSEIFVEEPPAPPPPPPQQPEPASVVVQPRVAAFVPAAVPAPAPQVQEARVPRAGTPWLGRTTVLGGWGLLVALVLVIG